MGNDKGKSFRRSWLRWPAPGKQLMLFLPTASVLAVLIVVGGFALRSVQTRALETMAARGVSSEVSREFLQQTQSINIVIFLVTTGVAVAAVLWVWWLSVWVFGPTRRLERDLNEVLYGRMDPDKIRVRPGDALFSLVERVREALKSKPPEPPRGA